MIIIEVDGRNMKRCDMKRIILILVFLLAMIIPGNVLAASNVEVNIDPDSPFEEGAFYGIWMGASKELEDAVVYASDYPAEIGAVQIFLTTDWENLNPEPWYVLTAGMYASRTEAESVLPMIQAYYPDAYVKYSGKRLSHFANDTSKTSGWLGTWIADDGEKLVITDTSDVTLSMIYYGYYAKGGMFESPYILFFQNSEKTIAAEAQEVLDIEGWRRELELSGDVIVMHSRYPDKLFYRVPEPTDGNDIPKQGSNHNNQPNANGKYEYTIALGTYTLECDINIWDYIDSDNNFDLDKMLEDWGFDTIDIVLNNSGGRAWSSTREITFIFSYDDRTYMNDYQLRTMQYWELVGYNFWVFNGINTIEDAKYTVKGYSPWGMSEDEIAILAYCVEYGTINPNDAHYVADFKDTLPARNKYYLP